MAVVVLARTAGEDHDNSNEKGSYKLTDKEENLLKEVTTYFKNVVVALNVGNIIDLSFLNQYPISSLLYIWQGGEEGANAFADILSGKSAPSGKLTDTIAYEISDYPSDANFGDRTRNIYKEDIFVGYRYFETFAKDKVMFPFGFGLTYTKFNTECSAREKDGVISVSANITNIGERSGKEVLQVYFKAPNDKLGNPVRQLIAFAKTKELVPNESEIITINFNVDDMASYDDSGITGNKSCYVLEAGNYEIFAGVDVRTAESVIKYEVNELKIIKQLKPILPPVDSFDKLCADGEYREIPLNNFSLEERILENRPKAIEFTGNKGIKLKDVYDKKHTLEEFIAQLTDDDLAALCCGEGMNSPKATPGTGGALGGQTESLSNYGIPVCCVTDGPSGVRLDDGKLATSIPNGTSLASTWDIELVEEIYTHIGIELKKYCVDALLGPGINIHRHPLCGRNFEYFSEDPYLTGSLAAAVTRGIAKSDVYSTIKHFCCNNQETSRYDSESVVGERTLREIYLKPFEIAIKQGENVLVMTAYNPVNGYWTASNYDLTHTVLREEWGFDNFVMTDWNAKCNIECRGAGDRSFLRAMVRAENDVYMVCKDANATAKCILDGLKQDYITRSELQRSAKNICSWILKTNTFKEYLANNCIPKYPITVIDDKMEVKKVVEYPFADKEYEVELNKGSTVMYFTVSCNTDVLAQNPITVNVNGLSFTFSVCGTDGKYTEIKRSIELPVSDVYKIRMSFADVVSIKNIIIKQ